MTCRPMPFPKRFSKTMQYILLTVLMIQTVAYAATTEDDPMNAPWNVSPAPPATPARSYFQTVAFGLTAAYQTVLHPALSSGCPSYPPCSAYMMQAIERFGFPAGYILGLERLLHETGEVARGCMIRTPDGERVFDPIENNTFWWSNHD